MNLPEYVEVYLRWQLMLVELIAERIGLDEINEGVEGMHHADHAARSVLPFG